MLRRAAVVGLAVPPEVANLPVVNVDWHDAKACRNPKGPDSGEKRALRGGSWYNHANGARVALRRDAFPTHRATTIGFRCAKNAP